MRRGMRKLAIRRETLLHLGTAWFGAVHGGVSEPCGTYNIRCSGTCGTDGGSNDPTVCNTCNVCSDTCTSGGACPTDGLCTNFCN